MKFKSKDWGEVTVEEVKYLDENPAFVLYDKNGEELVVLSVNLPQEKDRLGPGEFFVKTWSENADLAREALASGLFIDTGKRVPTGYVEAHIWKKGASAA